MRESIDMHDALNIEDSIEYKILMSSNLSVLGHERIDALIHTLAERVQLSEVLVQSYVKTRIRLKEKHRARANNTTIQESTEQSSGMGKYDRYNCKNHTYRFIRNPRK